MQKILQNSAAEPLEFFLELSSDGKTGATGLSPTVTLSKNGGAFAAPSGAVSEIGNGWYKVAPNATDSNTLGPLILHATCATADDADFRFQIVGFNPRSGTNLGLSALPTANPAASGGLPTVNASNQVLALDGSGNPVATSSALSTLSTAVANLNNLSALCVLYGPTAMEVPASGSIAYPFVVLVKDVEGHMLDLTGSPTISAANAASTDRSANLSSVTHAATGQYTFTYTVASSATEEGISIKASGTASDSTTRIAYSAAAIVAVDTATQIAAIKAKTDLIATNSADSPNAVTAQGNAATAATQATTAATQSTTAATQATTAATQSTTAATQATAGAASAATAATQATAGAASAATAVAQTTAAAILGAVCTTANKVKTNSSNQVETSNPATIVNVTVVPS